MPSWDPTPPADRWDEAWLAWANAHPVSAAFTHAEVFDREGRLCATANASFAVVDAGLATVRR
jgi:hypothetical protein